MAVSCRESAILKQEMQDELVTGNRVVLELIEQPRAQIMLFNVEHVVRRSLKSAGQFKFHRHHGAEAKRTLRFLEKKLGKPILSVLNLQTLTRATYSGTPCMRHGFAFIQRSMESSKRDGSRTITTAVSSFRT